MIAERMTGSVGTSLDGCLLAVGIGQFYVAFENVSNPLVWYSTVCQDSPTTSVCTDDISPRVAGRG